ncbi:S-adenosyl-L-methionine-dependent methyltransferase, partial [Tricladium varicosporioides]
MWDEAMRSWKANFPMAAGYTLRADEFINKTRIGEIKNVKVDVVHLSPPCQYFSPAHTHKGPNDEMNTASLFAVGELLAVVKPRIVTLEQTWGLLWERYQDYFHNLIHMFTSHGYSVRWSLVHFQEWGLPASRRRLIIIASCPGESLPTMPPPTHALSPSPGSGLRPFTTVNKALSKIPIDHPLKNVLGNTLKTPKREWVGNVIMKQAMTCNGGGNYHMSGLRDFNLAEYAALQGFPMNFKFCGSNNTNIKKQMGNAIPPSVARRLFEWIKKWLDGVDGIVEEPIVI